MLKRIPLDLITRNPDQPRQTFDQTALEDLAESIRQNGLKQPITVRPMPMDENGCTHMVVMGERRYRAHLLLAEDGDAENILCHVRKMDDQTMHIDAILENLQRAEVAPLEEAAAYQVAIEQHGFTPATLAKRLGIGQVWRITDRLRLLGLRPRMQELMASGIITPTQAYHMAPMCAEGQEKFLTLVKQGLAVSYKACADTAAAIQSKLDQVGMDLPAMPQTRASAKPVEDKIDAIGRAVAALFKDGEIQVPDGIMLSDADKCLQKLKLLKRNIANIESALATSAALTAVV